MRHWKFLKGPKLYGTDYNPELISWCQRQLGKLAEFKTNKLTPPLDYANEQFDLIYSISVFTHLTEDLQYAWLNELGRVLKHSGLILITLHGESRLHQLETEEQQRFRAGELIVKQQFAAGSNLCGAYHPEQYVRHHLAQGFEVMDFVPVGVRDADQDIYLLRKPA